MESQENLFTYVEVSTLRVGSHIVHNDRPCKITEINVSKTGKHGAAKAVMVMKDIFTGSKHSTSYSTAEKVKEPVIKVKLYILVDINDEEVVLLNEKNEQETFTIGKHPMFSEIETNILNDFTDGKQIELKVMFAMNDFAIQSFTSKQE